MPAEKCPGCGREAIKKPLDVCSVCHRPVRTAAQRGRHSRGKGNEYENHCAKKLSAWWGEPKSFRRTPSSGGWDKVRAPTDMVTPDGWPFDVECKKVESWELIQLLKSPEKCLIEQHWQQTVNECRAGKYPWLIFSRNFQPDFVMMDVRSFGWLCSIFGPIDLNRFRLRARPGDERIILILDELLPLMDPEHFRQNDARPVAG